MTAPTERARTIVARGDLPPASGRITTRDSAAFWQAVADEVRATPGEWCWVAYSSSDRAPGIAFRIRTAALVAFAPAGSFTAETRSTPAGTQVWACYPGEVTR